MGETNITQVKIIKQHPLTISESRERLLSGNETFRLECERYQRHRGQLAEVDEYDVVILTCADARSDSSLFRDFTDNKILFLQVAGNVYDPENAIARAKIDAALRKLEPGGLLIEMGHAKCGAVDANAHADHYVGKVSRHVDRLVALVDRRHATTLASDDYRANAINQAMRLASHPEVIKKGIKVLPCSFDFTNGEQDILATLREGAEPAIIESLRASGISRLRHARDNGYDVSAQYAHAIVISDPLDLGRFSNPRIVFNANLNEVFAVSAVGRELSSEAIASIEYALLKVNGVKDAPHIVIMHSDPTIAEELKERMLRESEIIRGKTKHGQLITVMQYNQLTHAII